MKEIATMPAAQAVAAMGVLQRLMSYPFEDIHYNVVFSRAFAVLSKNPEIAAMETVRQRLVEKYGERDKDGTGLHVPPAKFSAFAAEYEEATKHDIELKIIKVPMSALALLSKDKKITPQDIMFLDGFIDEDE